MAKATLNKTKKKVVVEQEVVTGMTLKLSNDEALALYLVLRRVGGCPETSLRGHIKKIHDAIKKHNVFGDGIDCEGLPEGVSNP